MTSRRIALFLNVEYTINTWYYKFKIISQKDRIINRGETMDQRKSMTIRINEDLHTKIKIRVAKQGITITDYILKLVEEDLKLNEN